MIQAQTIRRIAPIAVWVFVLAALGIALGPMLGHMAGMVASGEVAPHAPDWPLWLRQPLAIHLHVYAALIAFFIGVVMLARPKGDALHRVIGWSWVIAMGVTAVSSLFITSLNGGFYSFVHLISGWVLIALPAAIYAVRRGNIRQHRAIMIGVFVGGMLIAGGLTLLPGRLIWNIFMG